MREIDEQKNIYRSHHHAEKTTDTPLLRVMALHALVYCERLFYLEEVEEIRIADANVYSGRRLHDALDKGTESYSVELASEKLGIRGKLDYARKKSGELVIYEHKKGHSKNGEKAWPSDRLQAFAYAFLLSEGVGEEVRKANIRYHADNKTISLDVNENARLEVEAAIIRARELRSMLERPPVTVSENLCHKCSLAPVCLPEEERFRTSPLKRPRRLFPVDHDRCVIHVVEQGSLVRKSGEQLVVHMPDGKRKPLPGIAILALVLHGNVQISTQAIHFCAANSIGLHWLSYGGSYVGAFTSGTGGVQRKVRQYRALEDNDFKTRIAIRLVSAKVENQLKYALRALRNKGNSQSKDPALEQMRNIICKLSALEKESIGVPYTQLIKKLRGYEGLAGKEYFSLLPRFLQAKKGDLLYFKGRNRRPPKDPFNAILSFGYALLYRDCLNALLTVGLEPALGCLHTPRSAAYPLALDLMELFRVISWDMPAVASVNRKQWKKDDFEITTGQTWLSTQGRRKAIDIYERRKQEKWKHPVLHYSLSYARTIELESRLLEKEWDGEPGLFAKQRLR